MKYLLKEFINRIPAYSSIRNWKTKRKQKNEVLRWEKKGKPAPPPHIIKQRTLLQYAQKFGLKNLVETGTLCGDMVEAMKNDFDCIYSIELSYEFYAKSKDRFKREEHIGLIHGDSGIELKNVINRLDQPALFWLDGHYSGGDTAIGDKETPILEELDHILNDKEKKHVIIIDDARCFGDDPAYPSIEELNKYITSKRPDVEIIVQDDSIRITPQ